MTFREKNNFEKRQELFRKIEKSYPERIPIIAVSKGLTITREKFLAQKDTTVGHLLNQIRLHISKLPPEQALFLMVKNVMPSVTANIENVYEQYKDKDGFLYCSIRTENTFGSFI